MNNTINMPMIGLGTWLIPNDDAEQISTNALNLGYRHIDTAQVYRNEEGIGKALTSSSIPRDDIFITTKMWPGMFGQEEPFQNLFKCEIIRLTFKNKPRKLISQLKYYDFAFE